MKFFIFKIDDTRFVNLVADSWSFMLFIKKNGLPACMNLPNFPSANFAAGYNIS